ncbi:MAG: sulfurtransferase [Oceanospirillaceae bacterium]|uniref:rhodanese-like domain-containing protein n=1 Tax=unclassified Thalassolituus TaxID=2624967 RepID=UPI000C08F5B4|nr:MULTISPECIES: rhodanese-like domain-containing protein [unclassified Thalassolituus]MAK90300.1 sulfurtransferase [Thalassolituus sp.]MAS24524.1 sulfurtransferase [Oceanospirillaceae bacterium]MAX97617.1 sulfurtransferase [Oceanospirillaceae bacterium]MBS52589.1 sulfurtransferase [Oceanospirillaceae bacterium]|tara:strand:+ start:439 stop:852 length:414 start_codon:yes stop_codon:yes gene_type:complete
MDRLFDFVANHWWLVGIWGAFLLALLWDNNRRSGLSVSTSQATRMANSEDAVFVDIRDSKDFNAGHIANAVNIPFSALASRMNELDKYKDKPLILVCKSGQTVNMAGKTLREKGFNAVRMSGGMMEWSNQNLPVVRG